MRSTKSSNKHGAKTPVDFNNLVKTQYDVRLPGSQRLSSYVKKKPSPYSNYDINGHKTIETPTDYNIKSTLSTKQQETASWQQYNGDYARQAGALREQLDNGFKQLQDNITSSQLVYEMNKDDIARDHSRLEIPKPQIKPQPQLTIERVALKEQSTNKIVKIPQKEQQAPQLTKQLQQELLQIIKFPLDKSKDVKELVFEYKNLKFNKFQQINAIKQLIQMYGSQYNRKLAKNVNPLLVCFKKIQQHNNLNKLRLSMINANQYQYELMLKLIVIKTLQKIIGINQHMHSSQFNQQINESILKKTFIHLKKVLHIHISNTLLANQHYQFILQQRLFYYIHMQTALASLSKQLNKYQDVKTLQNVFIRLNNITNNSREKQLFDVLTSRITNQNSNTSHHTFQLTYQQYKREINGLSLRYKVIKQKVYSFAQIISKNQIQRLNQNNMASTNMFSMHSTVQGLKQQLSISSTNIAKTQTQLCNTSMVKSKLNIFMAPNVPLTNIPSNQKSIIDIQPNNLQNTQLKIDHHRRYLNLLDDYNYETKQEKTFRPVNQLQQSYLKLQDMKQKYQHKSNIFKSQVQPERHSSQGKNNIQQILQSSRIEEKPHFQTKNQSIYSLFLDKKTHTLIIRCKYISSLHQLMLCNTLLYLHTDESKHRKTIAYQQKFGSYLQLKIGFQISNNNSVNELQTNKIASSQNSQLTFFDVNNLNAKLIQYLKQQSIFGAVDVLSNVYRLYKALLAMKTVYLQELFYKSVNSIGDTKQKQIYFNLFKSQLINQKKKENVYILQFQKIQAKRYIFNTLFHIHYQIIDKVQNQKASKIFKLVIMRRQIKAWYEVVQKKQRDVQAMKQITDYLSAIWYYRPVFSTMVETYRFIVTYRVNEKKIAIFITEYVQKKYFNWMRRACLQRQHQKKLLKQFFITYFNYLEQQKPETMLRKCFQILLEQQNDNLSLKNVNMWYNLKLYKKIFELWSGQAQKFQLQRQFQEYICNNHMSIALNQLLRKYQYITFIHEKVKKQHQNYNQIVIWEALQKQYNIISVMGKLRYKFEQDTVSNYYNKFVNVLLQNWSDQVSAKCFHSKVLYQISLQSIVSAFLVKRKYLRLTQLTNTKIITKALKCILIVSKQLQTYGWSNPKMLALNMKADGFYIQKLEQVSNYNVYANFAQKQSDKQFLAKDMTTKKWPWIVRLWYEEQFRHDMMRTNTLDDIQCQKYIQMFHYHIYRVVINTLKQNVQEKAFYNSKRIKQTNTEGTNLAETNDVLENINELNINIEQLQNAEQNSLLQEQTVSPINASDQSDDNINIKCTSIKQQVKQLNGDDIFQKKIQSHKNWRQNQLNSKNSILQSTGLKLQVQNKYNEQIKKSLLQQKQQISTQSTNIDEDNQLAQQEQSKLDQSNNQLIVQNEDRLLPQDFSLNKQVVSTSSQSSEIDYEQLYKGKK